MHSRRSPVAIEIATICLAILVFGACASTTGGGGGTAPDVAAAPAKKASVKDEVGANGLPTPAALVARYVDAIGGEKVLRQHRSSTRTGKMSIAAMGMEGSSTTRAAAPNKIAMSIETGMGAMNQGFNGEVGWADNPMTGVQILDGDQLANMKRQADFFAPLNYSQHFTTMETVEETEFNGMAAYKVKLVGSSGRESFEFFAKDTGLLLGMQGVQDGPMGESEVKLSFSDYKDFGGMKVPGKTTIDVAGMQIEQTVDAVTFDDVDPAAFDLPEAVKAQLK